MKSCILIQILNRNSKLDCNLSFSIYSLYFKKLCFIVHWIISNAIDEKTNGNRIFILIQVHFLLQIWIWIKLSLFSFYEIFILCYFNFCCTYFNFHATFISIILLNFVSGMDFTSEVEFNLNCICIFSQVFPSKIWM